MKLETKDSSWSPEGGLQVDGTGEFPPCLSKAVAKETTFASGSLWDGPVDIYATLLLLRRKRRTSCGVFVRTEHRTPFAMPFSTTILAIKKSQQPYHFFPFLHSHLHLRWEGKWQRRWILAAEIQGEHKLFIRMALQLGITLPLLFQQIIILKLTPAVHSLTVFSSNNSGR